jgi:purine nucleosidase
MARRAVSLRPAALMGRPESRWQATLTAAAICAAALSLASGCGGRRIAAIDTLPKAASSAPLAVVLTTDCGVEIDDQWALTHILVSPELQLRAIVTTHASSVHLSSSASAAAAADVIAHVAPSRPPVQVIAGSSEPLHDAATPRRNPGLDLLIRVSRDFSPQRRLVVLIIGAATDTASAILEDPAIADRIAIVAMGFANWPDGGEEFNITNDRIAWQVILRSRVPLVIGSGAAARRSLRLTPAAAAARVRSHGATGQYLYELFDRWLSGNAGLASRMVAPGEWAIWDEVVVAYVLGFARGEIVPRPQLLADFRFAHPRTDERITWLTRVDAEHLWRDLARKLDARDRPRGDRHR